MILSTHGVIASQIQSFVGLLDLYPSAAAAYSLRKLRTLYTGSAIRVRRTDLAESDIGFTSAGNLDTTALLAFTGTGALDNGFVTTWYDQSGNGINATQTTALAQPQIVSAGSVINVNSKPCIQFTSALSNRLETSLISSSTEVSIISVSRHTPTSAYNPIVGVGNANGYALTTSSFKYNLFYRAVADQTTASNALSTQALIFAYTKSATNQQLFANDVSYQNFTPATMLAPTNSSRIGTYDNITEPYQGTQQELILYANSQLSNRSGMQTNINTYYAIY
jgi:hypothetical protein